MKRLEFNSQGKLVGVDGADIPEKKDRIYKKDFSKGIKNYKERNDEDEEGFFDSGIKIKIESFDKPDKRDVSQDSDYWSLYKNEARLKPLKFSNGKTQEDIVKEVVDLIKAGEKVIFLHGMCGTGKSAIALNVARVIGKTSIVVPVKGLQRQYHEDYMGKMAVYKKNGEKLRIAMITGRDNHDSLLKPGVSCADPFLPENIAMIEKNAQLIKEYYNENPFIKNKSIGDIRLLKRISIAPANPHWSPIIPAEYEVNLKDAARKRYIGLRGREFIFYHRKRGCSYYDQYQGYINSDIIIFNSAKYKIEVALDRKPETEVDIIDEADEFLDSFSNQMELNLTRLNNSLKNVISDYEDVNSSIDMIKELIGLEEKRIRAIGINEEQIFSINDTNLGKILKLFLKDRNVESEISMDDLSYANKGVEAAKNFIDFLDDTYLTYKRYDDNLFVNLVTTNLSRRLKDMFDKNKAFVFMSGTIHSDTVLKEIFGIEKYKTVEAETLHQGEIDILRTGKEFDCSYRNFKSIENSREKYLKAMEAAVQKAVKPFLVHVNAFEDLPSNSEAGNYGVYTILSRERLRELQTEDKTGKMISLFKKKLSDNLYSTKCSRGVDFPGDVCKSMIFSKYPNPNVQGAFWKILERTHSRYFWEFYKDKARREFLQRLYRALRSHDDHVYVLSPDLRVLDAVREIQLKKI